MIVYILTIFFVVLGAVIGFTVYKVKIMEEESATKIAKNEAGNYANQIKAEMEAALNSARTLANAFEGYERIPKQQRRKAFNAMLENVLKKNESFFGVWTCWEPDALDKRDMIYSDTQGYDETGRFIPYWYRSGEEIKNEPLKDYNNSNYYLLAKNKGKEVVLEPFSNKIEEKEVMMTSMVVPVKDGEEVLGVVGVDIVLDTFQKFISNIKAFKNSYGILLSNSGKIVSYPDKTMVGQELQKITDKNLEEIKNNIQNGKFYSYTADSKMINEEVYTVYSPVKIGDTNTPWSIAVAAPTAEVFSNVKNLMFWIIGAAITGLLITAILVWYFSGTITNPLIETADYADIIASGDFTREISEDLLKRRDEIGTLAGAFADMKNNLREIIGSIAEISDNVASFSQELTASSEELGSSAEQVGSSIQDVASGAEEQTAQIEKAGDTIKDLITRIEEVDGMSEDMSESAGEVMSNIEAGNDSVSNSINKIERVKANSVAVSDTVTELGDLSEEIGDIVELINSIAAQTNLLALNAAIEAARAGEAGRGFSVVADEIRELAEESATATDKIAGLIKSIQKKVNNAVDKMDETESAVAESVNAINETGASFENIKEAAKELTNLITKITERAQMMAQNSEQVETSVNDIARVSEEAASNAEEVAASSEQQLASIQEMSESAEQLAEMAEDLARMVDEFEV